MVITNDDWSVTINLCVKGLIKCNAPMFFAFELTIKKKPEIDRKKIGQEKQPI